MNSARRTSAPPASLFALSALVLVAACSGEDGQAQGAAGSAESPGAVAESAPAVVPAQDPLDLTQYGVDEGSVMTAVIAVVDFSDFGCIYCANFHLTDYPVLHEEFVAGGDVLWKYVPITIGNFPNGDLAGLTGICTNEIGPAGSFARIRDLLFVEREAWLNAPPAEARALLVGYAGSLGIEAAAFEACLDGEAATAELARNNEVARQVGVTGTPYFLVQGSPVRGAPPLENFQQVMRQIVAEARGAAAPAQPGGGPQSSAPDA
jgi:protein-disulfide isomerase